MTDEAVIHEEAMRQEAAERRQSQSARNSSHSRTKSNAEASPGASTDGRWTHWKAKHRLLEDTKEAGDAQETVGASSPMMVNSESSSDPVSRPTNVQVKRALLDRDGSVPFESEMDKAPVLSDDGSGWTGEVEREGVFDRAEVVQFEDEFFGEMSCVSPDCPSY